MKILTIKSNSDSIHVMDVGDQEGVWCRGSACVSLSDPGFNHSVLECSELNILVGVPGTEAAGSSLRA